MSKLLATCAFLLAVNVAQTYTRPQNTMVIKMIHLVFSGGDWTDASRTRRELVRDCSKLTDCVSRNCITKDKDALDSSETGIAKERKVEDMSIAVNNSPKNAVISKITATTKIVSENVITKDRDAKGGEISSGKIKKQPIGESSSKVSTSTERVTFGSMSGGKKYANRKSDHRDHTLGTKKLGNKNNQNARNYQENKSEYWNDNLYNGLMNDESSGYHGKQLGFDGSGISESDQNKSDNNGLNGEVKGNGGTKSNGRFLLRVKRSYKVLDFGSDTAERSFTPNVIRHKNQQVTGTKCAEAHKRAPRRLPRAERQVNLLHSFGFPAKLRKLVSTKVGIPAKFTELSANDAGNFKRGTTKSMNTVASVWRPSELLRRRCPKERLSEGEDAAMNTRAVHATHSMGTHAHAAHPGHATGTHGGTPHAGHTATGAYGHAMVAAHTDVSHGHGPHGGKYEGAHSHVAHSAGNHGLMALANSTQETGIVAGGENSIANIN